MLERMMKLFLVLALALFLGRALIGMLVDVVGVAASCVASGVGRTGSAVGSVLVVLFALVLVVGVLVRGKDALSRLSRPHERGGHGGGPGGRFARRQPVAGDHPSHRGARDARRRRVRHIGEE